MSTKSGKDILRQGQKKIIKRYHDIFNNPKFITRLDQLKKIKEPYSEEYTQQYTKLCTDYFLGVNATVVLGKYLTKDFTPEQCVKFVTSLVKEGYLDICWIEDSSTLKEDYLQQNGSKTINAPDGEVCIRISPLASQNEVINFIKKNWTSSIRPLLDEYQESSVYRRRRDQVLADFLVEYGTVGEKERSLLIAEKFPEHKDLSYKELNNIRDAELRRRNVS